MRRNLLLAMSLLAVCAATPALEAFAQGRPGGGGGEEDEAAAKRRRAAEWELRQAPLPGQRNAGPCPYVKVLYDAARYTEFNGGEGSGNVAYSGEIDGISAECTYKGADPIRVRMQIGFALGKGPQATASRKEYRYWVAVTQRNREVLAKEYFTLPVNFGGSDRAAVAEKVEGIVIPRATETISGDNFEVLVGFDVTPAMAEFNRQGKRFRINAGAPAAQPSGR